MPRKRWSTSLAAMLLGSLRLPSQETTSSLLWAKFQQEMRTCTVASHGGCIAHTHTHRDGAFDWISSRQPVPHGCSLPQ